jgi:hypothetical protein
MPLPPSWLRENSVMSLALHKFPFAEHTQWLPSLTYGFFHCSVREFHQYLMQANDKSLCEPPVLGEVTLITLL